VRATTWIGVSLCVAVISGCSSGYNLLRSATGTGAEQFQGTWLRNDARSDRQDRRWLSDWGPTSDWSTSGRYGDTRASAWRLPYEMNVDAGNNTIRITDANGSLVEEVALDDRYDRGGRYQNAQWRSGMLRGQWTGDREFQVTTTNANGATIEQTFLLDNANRMTVITRRTGDRGTRQFRWVYDRT